MSTATDTDILNALDFTPSLPCEHGQHQERHLGGGAAEWVAHRGECPGCARAPGRYLICEVGRSCLVAAGFIGCSKCGFVASRAAHGLHFEPLDAS